jgi:hypothetical protein
MDPGAIHPKLHLIRPPAQGQTGINGWPIWNLALAGQLLPSGRTTQLKLQVAPQTTAGPTHQATGIPIRAMQRTPRVLARRALVAIGLLAPPQGLEIPQGT